MRASVGHDFPDLGKRRVVQQDREGSLAVPAQESHPLLSRRISALWKDGRFGPAAVGRVFKVDAVTGGDRVRLTVEQDDGNTFRCYTDDRDWAISVQ